MTGYKPLFYDWMGANEYLFFAINSIHDPYYDEFMKGISWLGKQEHFPLYLAILFACYLLAICKKIILKKSGKWFYSTAWLGVFIVLIVGYAANGLAIREIKEYFSYPRPYIALADTSAVRILEATDPAKDYSSFPSGHVAFTTFMFIAVIPVLHSSLISIGLSLILLMCWSRVSLGMHFPADVIGAILITTPIMLCLRWVIYLVLRKVFRIKC